MKFFLSILIIAFLSFAASLYLPWWSIAIVAFVATLFIPQHPAKSFLSAFLSLFLLWGSLAFWLSYHNEHVLAKKVSLLILKLDNAYLLLLLTALIGGLVAGLAALCASLIRYPKRSSQVL